MRKNRARSISVYGKRLNPETGQGGGSRSSPSPNAKQLQRFSHTNQMNPQHTQWTQHTHIGIEKKKKDYSHLDVKLRYKFLKRHTLSFTPRKTGYYCSFPPKTPLIVPAVHSANCWRAAAGWPVKNLVSEKIRQNRCIFTIVST